MKNSDSARKAGVRASWALGSAGVALTWSAFVAAAQTGASAPAGSGSVTPQPAVNLSFQPGTGGANLASIITSCSPTAAGTANPVAQLQKVFEDGKKGTAAQPSLAQSQLPTIQNECAEVPVPDASSLTCESLGGPTFQLQLAQRQASVQQATAGLTCKLNKLKAIRGEMECLARQSQEMNQALQYLQQGGPGGTPPGYGAELSRIAAQASQLKDVIDERGAQDELVLRKLNGDPAAGVKGLQELVASTEAMVNAMPSAEKDLVGQMDYFESHRQALDQMVEQRTASLARQCLANRVEPRFLCEKNGKPVPLRDHILCIMGQQGTDARGQISSLNKARATGKSQRVDAVLTQLFNDLPETVPLPAKFEDFETQAFEGKARIKTAADVESLYGTALRSLGATSKGSLHDFLMFYVDDCFAKARQQIIDEKKSKSSLVTRLYDGMNRFRDGTHTQLVTQLRTYAEQYSAAMRTLTGVKLPFQTQACESASLSPKQQLGCFRDLQGQLRGLFQGTTDASLQKVAVVAKRPEYGFEVNCAGMQGCLTQLQNTHQQLVDEKGRVTAMRQKFIETANRNVLAYTQQIAAQLSPKSQMIANQLKAMNLALASLGVRSGIQIKSVDPEKPDYQEDELSRPGLVKAPQNLANFIGGMMTPPLLDVNGDTFQGGTEAIGEASQKVAENLGKAAEADQKLRGLASQCQSEHQDRIAESLGTQLDRLSEGACFGTDVCRGSDSSLDKLISDLGQITSGNFSSRALSSLDTGILGVVCRDSRVPPQQCQQKAVGEGGRQKQTWVPLDDPELTVWARGECAAQGGQNCVREMKVKAQRDCASFDAAKSQINVENQRNCGAVIRALQRKADSLKTGFGQDGKSATEAK